MIAATIAVVTAFCFVGCLGKEKEEAINEEIADPVTEEESSSYDEPAGYDEVYEEEPVEETAA